MDSYSSNFCPLLISIQVLFTSDNSIFGDEEIILNSESHFIIPQNKLLDVNKTYIDLSYGQKFEKIICDVLSDMPEVSVGLPQRWSMTFLRSAAFLSCSFFNSSAAFFLNRSFLEKGENHFQFSIFYFFMLIPRDIHIQCSKQFK